MATSSKQLRAAARRTFLRVFPDGFRDELYLAWERDYKVDAHRRWRDEVGGQAELRAALDAGRHREVAAAAVRVEAGRPLLFSFEKMALRDAVVRSEVGAQRFAEGLYDWLHGPGGEPDRFERWTEVVASLPRRQTRVATWPVVTVFGAIARPRVHMFVKPMTIRRAAEAYGVALRYHSTPGWETYSSVLELARASCAPIWRISDRAIRSTFSRSSGSSGPTSTRRPAPPDGAGAGLPLELARPLHHQPLGPSAPKAPFEPSAALADPLRNMRRCPPPRCSSSRTIR